MKVRKLLVIAILLFGFSLLSWIQRPKYPLLFEWQGPNDEFKYVLDKDGDGEINRFEWQASNFQTNIYNSEIYLLQSSDCDNNGRLTWQEYFNGIIKRKECSTENWLYANIKDSFRSNRSIFPLIFSEDEFSILSSSSLHEFLQLLTDQIKNLPSPMSEQDVNHNLFNLSCSNLNAAEFYSLPVSTNSSFFRLQQCQLENTTSEINATAVLLKIRTISSGSESDSHHLKAIFVPKETTQELFLIFPESVQNAEVDLISTKGMKDGLN